jgi:hypothetical protein
MLPVTRKLTWFQRLLGGIAVKRYQVALAVLLCGMAVRTVSAAELPADYFKLLEVEVKPLQTETTLKPNAGAMFAAAVLYAKEHQANSSFHDRNKRDLALALGDRFAEQSEQDRADNKQDYVSS